MRIKSLILRIIRQFIRDKRTLALMFMAPLLVLTLMYAVFNSDPYRPVVGLVNAPVTVQEKFAEQGVGVQHYQTPDLAELALKERNLDAYIHFGANKANPEIILEGSDPAVNRNVLSLVQQALTPASAADSANIKPHIEYLHGGPKLTAFDHFGPTLIAVFSFFFVFLIAGVSFLRERTGGTLERLLSTPIRRYEIVLGYIAGFGFFTIIQAMIIVGYCIGVLNIFMSGLMITVLLITMLLSLTALTLGTLLSTFAQNEFQMIQFIPLVIVPQIFFSGLFNLSTLPEWLQLFAHLMPLYYGAGALQDVMIRGLSWSAIATELAVLLLFSLSFMILNVLALRKHRRI
ncbi:ABC transporter permease [Paenibacillus swuensis]|uniref:ABC transporter permease n=1 Tax=Paenibacillus swuensis TaxID=1178515 RepID=A0A172TKH5_9BACL|nr:ABC transporter permease [Paenibacillus swuensis]ANE47424.1 ABC transporter permease [Paenibacillus swuensis]